MQQQGKALQFAEGQAQQEQKVLEDRWGVGGEGGKVSFFFSVFFFFWGGEFFFFFFFGGGGKRVEHALCGASQKVKANSIHDSSEANHLNINTLNNLKN